MTRALIRNAELDGRIVDIAIANGQIAQIGTGLRGEELLDARGGAAIPGLHDHHIHLLAAAARRASVPLETCANEADVIRCLRDAAAAAPQGAWLRATGYHEQIAGPLDRHALDRIVPGTPLRVQHQTGGLWMLNSAALALLPDGPWPDGAELDGAGQPTGRFFRCDAWLSNRIGRTEPDLAALGRELASFGITGMTDASVSTDADSAETLARASRDGRLPFRLTLMSGGPLTPPGDGAWTAGPVKILLDDDRLPPLDTIADIIADAREWNRPVAAHCVTAGELAIMLAAFQLAGSAPGDRIEHGGVIPAEAIPVLRELELTVVTQPGFIATRGERYRALVDPAEQGDLYRCASLIAAGVPVGGSSDAPYGDTDPWAGMAAAISRRTRDGNLLGGTERISPRRALNLYLAPPGDPGGTPRAIRPGHPADLCLLREPLARALARPDRNCVAATLLAGAVTYRAH
ncbi:MAG: amidohydrolase family protein [Novosphingobium sp.]|nr:amidohydrolase family protein [Novosphingobium sp.]